MAESFSAWQKKQGAPKGAPRRKTPTDKGVVGELLSRGLLGVGKFPSLKLGEVGSAYEKFSKTKGGGILDYLLQAPEYAAAGYLTGTRRKAEELAGTGVKGVPSALAAGFKGIPLGLKERTTIPDYLQKEVGLSPGASMALGLPASIAIPAVPIGKIAKATKIAPKVTKGLKAVGEIPVPASRFGRKLGQLTTYRYGQPKKYAGLAEEAITGIRGGGERALELGKPVSELKAPEQVEIAKYLKGEIPTTKYKKLADPIREEFMGLGEEAVKEGLLKESTFKKNVGKYLPRMYRKWEEGAPALGRFLKKPQRIDISRFMKRQDIAEDTRKAMGEILEAGYPTTKGISQLAQSVTKAKFFRVVSENPEWVSKTAKEGWDQLPTVKTLGKLSGKWVIPPVFDDIQAFTRVPGDLEKIMGKATSWWKYGKVVVNPATVSRNVMSNVILADTIGGLSPARVDVYISALSDMSKQAEHYQEAKDIGLLGKTFYGAEIKDMLNGIEEGKGIMDVLKKPVKKAGNFYQAVEELFKLAVFKFQRGEGKNIQQAAKIAEDALFDYSRVPESIKTLRQSVVGFPFITFAYKATPALAKQLVKTPSRFAKYQKVFKAVEGLTSESVRKEEEAVKPEWMKKFGRQFLRLPTKDKHGRSSYLDISYILPWFGFAGLQPFKHPGIAIFNDLQKNKDYFGKEIYSDIDTEGEKYAKISKYVWQQLAPSIPGLPGTYQTQKLVSGLLQKPDYMGRTRSRASTIFDVFFGIKTFPFDVKEQKYWRTQDVKRDISDVKTEMKKTLRKPGVSPEEKEKVKTQSKEKLKKLMELLTTF